MLCGSLLKSQDKHGKRKKGWAVGGSLKGVRLDAEGGGASLDNEKLVPVDIVDNGGPPVGAGKELEASIDAGPGAGKKVGYYDFSLSYFCISTQLCYCMYSINGMDVAIQASLFIGSLQKKKFLLYCNLLFEIIIFIQRSSRLTLVF